MTGERLAADSLGTLTIPAGALWGTHTQRALLNFPVSGWLMPGEFLRSMALVKELAARVNGELGLLPGDKAGAIARAAAEIASGAHQGQFPLDVFQTGSATSTHMNLNEVIAGRARQLLGGAAADPALVHANDHVNVGQSSNDVVPTTLHLAAWTGISQKLMPALTELAGALEVKAHEFAPIIKVGRTHLQDATPVRLGQEFSGYSRQVTLAVDRLATLEPRLTELALGGTAVGTGINAHPEFAARVIEGLRQRTGIPWRRAGNSFEAQSARDAAVEAGGILKTVAVSLAKIAEDLRWLASGPRAGLGEIVLPELQAGSSIMPGKVNPVIPEMVLLVCAQVIGSDATLTLCGLGGHFELNTMMPLMAYHLLHAISLLERAVVLLRERCVSGIEALPDHCRQQVERSLALATPLARRIGYDRTAEIVREALASGVTIRVAAGAAGILPADELDSLLDPEGMLAPWAEPVSGEGG